MSSGGEMRRAGHFKIERRLIDAGFGKAIFRDMVPWRVEYLGIEDAFDVTAVCDEFAPVPMGCLTPTYSVIITETVDEVYDPTTGLTKKNRTFARVIAPYEGVNAFHV